MSKPFDYSKWDNIELSDDEDDLHPNIDRESWFRMKHRSRVEREENEEKDKANIRKEMEKATQRMQILQHELNKIAMQKVKTNDSDSDDDDDDDDDDDINDKEALQAELEELQQQNQARQKKLDEYEKNKKWNVDNMFQVKEDRSMVNPNAGKVNYTPDGYIAPKEDAVPVKVPAPEKSTTAPAPKAAKEPPSPAPQSKVAGPALTSPQFDTSKEHIGVMATYPDFVEKYADTIELFMKLSDLEQSKDFLLRYGDILLQENAANYLLLASLEDEMNGYHEKMKKTARQSQIITHIAELAKTLKTHPGNVIMPFFARLQQREHLEEFVQAVTAFQEKIVQRAIVKKQEMDAQRQQEDDSPRDLSEIPLEQRLGPGGLDPLEVIESLPQEMVEAFESRSVEALKEVLSKMKPEDAEYHMKRCVDSGLWVANA